MTHFAESTIEEKILASLRCGISILEAMRGEVSVKNVEVVL